MLVPDMLEWHNDLRIWVYDYARRNNGKAMGEYAWLCHALSENDITLTSSEHGLCATGTTYTVQTMDWEWFDFCIPWSEVPLDFMEKK